MSFKKPIILVGLPAYNESEAILTLLSRINKTFHIYNINGAIVVINDGSSDNTLELVKSYNSDFPLEVVDVQPNQGLANAMRVCLNFAANKLDDDDILVTMDADDTHNPFLLMPMISKVFEGNDIVIASRYRYGSHIVGLSPFRKFLSSGVSLLFTLFNNVRGVKDYTCGFRAYKINFLKQLHQLHGDKLIEQEGFGCMAEILIKSKKLNPIITEVPMVLRYDQKLGASKMNIFKTIKQTLKLIIQK